MNRLYIGFSKQIELPKRGFLYIDDEVPDVPRSRIFDPHFNSFNPLKGIDYKKARELADVLYTVYPQGENTLTVRNGKRLLLAALLDADRFDRVRGPRVGKNEVDEVGGMTADLLASPVLRRVLCSPTNFSFNPNSRIFARINRAELGEFDALVLGLLLMAQFKGTVIIPDLGFYGRDAHVGLLREERLIAGVNTLSEMPVRLRQMALLIEDKRGSGTTAEDAETLAAYAGLQPNSNAFNDFVRGAMG
jgi:hypothetical protein